MNAYPGGGVATLAKHGAAGAAKGEGLGWRSYLTVAIAGAAHAASLAWPWGGQALWWLQILALTALCIALLHAQTSRQSAWAAGWFACTWLSATFWWLFISMHTYGGLPAPLAVLAVLALAAFLATYYAAAAWVWQRWRGGATRSLLLFAALWTLAELARGTLWTGFPWGAGGYAHVQGPLAVFPRWVGVYGTGALAALVAMALALLQQGQYSLRNAKAWWVAGLVAVVWCGAFWSQQAAQSLPGRAPVSVALLQGNIPQDEKFVPGMGVRDALQWYGEQLTQPQADLVVAPETALPLLPQQLPIDYWQAIARPYQTSGSQHAALVGIPLGNENEGYTNSVIGWMPGEMPKYRYDKHHLVPFGEFVPPMFHWFVRMMNIPLGDFARGSVGQASMDWRGERWAPNICYEDLFGEELGARFRAADQAPTVFVNVSNIAWFGDSIAIDQHLHISRMRALEFERPMVRATNTGATVVIDHRGDVTAALPAHTQAVLQAQVQGRDGVTPFAQWVSRLGLWPLWLCCLAVWVWCLQRRPARK